jgi:hypothetical protein
MTMMPGPDLWATLAKRLDRIERQLNQVKVLETFGASGGALGGYVILKVVSKAGIADNSATAIFTVTTTNETGDADGGGFTCKVETMVGHAISPIATDLAIEWNYSVFQRINKADGTDYGALGEIYEGASTASASATRDIGATTPTITLTSNTVTTFNLTIDLTGTGVDTASAVCLITLIWYGYSTSPTIASA